MIQLRSVCRPAYRSSQTATTVTAPRRLISSGSRKQVGQGASEHLKAEGNVEREIARPQEQGSIEHLVILPDRPNVLARRVEIRPQHSPNFLRLHNEGYVPWAGPLFHDHVEADITRRPFKGSVMVVKEGSWKRFNRAIESDPYVRENIWDLEKTKFIPFRTLMRVDVSRQIG